MKEKMFLLAILLILIGVLWFFTPLSSTYEGFTNTTTTLVENRLQDRANPLAASTNPLQNPAVPVGTTIDEANRRRQIALAGLNIPTAIPNADGSFTQAPPTNPISPRIDDEGSYLGLIKFCKEEGRKSGNPFDNSKFAESCGVCFTSGSLATGETFSTPTGVLVYQKDKEKAIRKKQEAGHLFPRVIPSMNAAVCKNASTTDDSMPVLAITKEDYSAFSKRLACRHKKEFGNSCGICQVNKEWSWINPQGGIQGTTLYFWGEGELIVKINGVSTAEKPYMLNDSKATIVPLGKIIEGNTFEFNVRRGESINGPFIFGALVSMNANGKPYRISIDKIIQKDRKSGSTPRKSTPKFFLDVRMSLSKLVAQGTTDEMILDGIFPFTFIEKDQLASYDCATSPMFQKLESADLLIQDPCIRPGPNSVDCIRSRIIEHGCTPEGELYKNEEELKGASQALQSKELTINQIINFIKDVAKADRKNKEVWAGTLCSGSKHTTPCDTGDIRNPQCLEFLYENKGKDYPRFGPMYRSGNRSHTSLNATDKKDIQFCQRTGTLHPSNPQGYNELLNILNEGYKGTFGLEGLRKYLTDVYTKATSNLDANLSDAKGGKKDSFMKCFGYTLADAPLPSVKLNSQNKVTTDIPENCDLQISYRPRQNWLWRTKYYFRQNYILSFSIIPRGRIPSWANIVHFTIDGNMGKFGERTPAIWFTPNDTRLHVRIGDSKDTNWGFDTSALPINQESKFRLICQGNKVTCTLNDRVWNYTQPTRRFEGIGKIYLGDPWHPAANCEIKNFCYSII